MAKIDSKLSRDDHLGLMVGGLRSPCLNAMYPIHSRDELGLQMRTFDGIFENEREKETFYVECMVRCLMMSLNNNNEEYSTTMKKQRIDEIKTCRVTRTISQIRKALNDYGKMNKLPRTVVCVDEDFHYMRGRVIMVLTMIH